jgi:hypothetical protein
MACGQPVVDERLMEIQFVFVVRPRTGCSAIRKGRLKLAKQTNPGIEMNICVEQVVLKEPPVIVLWTVAPVLVLISLVDTASLCTDREISALVVS